MAEQMISEVLEFAGRLATKKEKIEYLQANNSRPLRNILKGSYDDSVEFNLPKGRPSYRKDDAPKGLEPSNLHRVSRRFKYFFKGGIGDQLSSAKRERMFINCLESLHPSEAELLLVMKDKKMAGKYKGLTPALIADAFPTLLEKPLVTAQERSVAKKAAEQ
jgi:hypothetical protein